MQDYWPGTKFLILCILNLLCLCFRKDFVGDAWNFFMQVHFAILRNKLFILRKRCFIWTKIWNVLFVRHMLLLYLISVDNTQHNSEVGNPHTSQDRLAQSIKFRQKISYKNKWNNNTFKIFFFQNTSICHQFICITSVNLTIEKTKRKLNGHRVK